MFMFDSLFPHSKLIQIIQIYSITPTYRAPIYGVLPFTRPQFYTPKTSYMPKSM